MKLFLCLPGFILMSSFIPSKHVVNILPAATDTPAISHQLDGSLAEWPTNKFEEDNVTNIKYAVDNDAKNLYIAMISPAGFTQIKMIRQGMEVYIDMSGKKKEDKGIGFPVNKGANFNPGNNQPSN